ncbi:MAG: MBL fold metallo-hydrolase [Candidatus Vogelbacteria bacterium]|nr:MBL fold metallo-hydrolase [Candidatus Vogelbacteria bacterium]
MIITYYGMSCFKAQVGDSVLAFNPISKDSDLKPSRFSSDIAVISLNDKNYNGVAQVSGGRKELFVVDGPGEYEISSTYIKGFGIREEVDKETSPARLMASKINTIYSVLFEDVNICHLGALSVPEISSEIKEELGEIDILFVPVTGGGLISASLAAKIATSLEPKIVIPVHGDERGPQAPALKAFLKETGSEDVKPVEKLTIKKKDLEIKEGEVVVLEPVV